MKWPPETPVIYGRDYGFSVAAPPPPGYPQQPAPDTFSEFPFAEAYAARRQSFFDYILRNPAPAHFKAPYHELARAAAGAAPHEGVFFAACDFIDARKDCSDFVLHSLLRLLYQFPHAVSAALQDRIRATILAFKYWPDEPGVDSMCTWTENHQILFAAAGYLAGQMFPKEVFSNAGITGREQVERARPRILRWLDLRFRTGFSEWLSNVYYDEDLTPLLGLVDFAADEHIRRNAEQVIHLMLLDMALNSFRGVFGCTHGRSYENSKKWARNEGVTDTMKLLFGTGIFSGSDNMSAVCFALSQRYQMPPVLYAVAHNRDDLWNRQRMGIRLAEAARWGLGFDSFEDGMVFLSLEAYLHPRTVNLVMRMFDAYRWWQNGFFEMFARRRSLINLLRRLGLMPVLARLAERDLCRNTREEVNIATYRTAHYMLSAAVDYRAGYGGDQQHIWQATLGPDAVCFTTHPARREGPTPDYWSGSGTLPRVAQWMNVVIAVYSIDTSPGLYLTSRLCFTHAWLPRDRFDAVQERGGWIFARKGAGYLALRSQRPYRWQDQPGEDQDREVIADGKTNIWICEMGSQEVYGSFDAFIEAICAAPVRYDGLQVTYTSPSQGALSFGWRGPFLRGGQTVALGDFPRWENAFVQAPFPCEQAQVRAGEHALALEGETGEPV
jgi:hypothetical protein